MKSIMDKLMDNPLTSKFLPSVQKKLVVGGPQLSKEELMTDYGNGKRFVYQHKDQVFFSHEQKQWFLWDGKRWKQDDENKVVQLAHETAKSIIDEANRLSSLDDREPLKKWATTSLNHPRITKMLESASSYLTRKVDELDPHKHLLNVQNGIVDLRTGDLKPHDRSNLMSKLSPLNYISESSCPLWLDFMSTIFSDDVDMIRYIQKMIGYCLTGEISEKCFFILYGPAGDNGKTVLMNVLLEIMNDYAVQNPVDTLVSRRPGSASNDLVRLRKARLVSASEAADRYSFDEPLVKRLTGDDPIVGRPLYKEFITFKPECKIILATNQIPKFKGDDIAFSKRIRIIPFMVSIPVDKQDPHLKAKLLEEKEGILAWCIDGSRLWYQERLGEGPQVVEPEVESTLVTYVLSFISEKCLVEPAASERTSNLYESFINYLNDNNIDIDLSRFNSSQLGAILTNQGYASDHKNNGNVKLGIRINPM